ncbi:MAG: insulinase family protein [Pirellulaceae bacterium]|nr:insulinase family protein [Pirellulaceae bacterium]
MSPVKEQIVAENIFTEHLDNGMTIVAESMDWLESVAFSLLVPAGCSRDAHHLAGLANFSCEMVQRGCGSRDSRQFIEDLDNLGVERSANVSTVHTSFGGAMVADKIYEALAIYCDLIRRPHLPEDQFEDGRLVCLQEIQSAEDDLPQKVMQEVRRRQYGEPFGRPAHGRLDCVQAINGSDVQAFVTENYQPQDCILSVAGKIDWPRLREHIQSLWGDWQPVPLAAIQEQTPLYGYRHFNHDSTQTHLGISYSSVPYPDDDYYQARGAVGVLSDGMSSRLFTEVRENRGLCYTVFASCHSLRNRGCVVCYSGTTTDRAQETLDVMVAELKRLADGIEVGELRRLKARIKSALIMQQESSASRSSSIAADWYFLQRVQTLDEISQKIDVLSCESINEYLRKNPPGDFTVVTLGEQPLEMPVGVSTENAR